MVLGFWVAGLIGFRALGCPVNLARRTLETGTARCFQNSDHVNRGFRV